MEGVLELAGAYECSCRHDGYPILPQVAACGEFVEHTALFRLVQQILPEDIRRRQIYKVPIVCPVPAFKIEAGYLAAAGRALRLHFAPFWESRRHFFDKQKESGKARLVVFTGK